MRAYYYDNSDLDPREPHDSGKPVSLQDLSRIGVHYHSLKGEAGRARLEEIATEQQYKNRDVITISKDKLPNYEEKIKMFFEEHIHADDEVRYILDGRGYFDVRSADDEWIRIAMESGDMIILPTGIYHRFTLDRTDYIQAMRLFKEDPQWTPINRPADDNEYRVSYVNHITTLSTSA